MVNTRSLVVSIFCAVLSAPLIEAQHVTPSEAGVIPQRPAVIQELESQRQGFLGFSLQADRVSAPFLYAPDLSRYREFQFGMNLTVIAKQAGLEPSEGKVIHERPALIQELKWQPQLSRSSSPQAEPVRSMLFSFYNG